MMAPIWQGRRLCKDARPPTFDTIWFSSVELIQTFYGRNQVEPVARMLDVFEAEQGRI